MIHIEGLRKTYPGEDHAAVAGVSIDLPSTGLIFLVGPSGAGKSTFASILAGMDDDFSGRVESFGWRLDECDSNQLSAYRAQVVGLAFQDGFLEESCRPWEEVSKPLLALGESRHRAVEESRELLVRLGLEKVLDRHISELSGGERKRVALAKAMVKRPKLLIVDEPTAGLNEQLAHRVMAELRGASSKDLVIVITHERALVDEGSALIMVDGHLTTSAVAQIDGGNPIYERPVKSNLFQLVCDALRSYLRGLKGYMATLFSMAFAVTVAGFATLMVQGVGEGLRSVVGTTLDELSAVVQPAYNENADNPENIYLSPEEISSALAVSPETTMGYGAWYVRGVNATFSATSGFRLRLGSWSYPRQLGMDILSECYPLASRPGVALFPEIVGHLASDEVVLGLPDGMYEALIDRAGGLDELHSALEEGQVLLSGSAGIEEAQGVKEFNLKVVSLFSSSSVVILHTDPLFASQFFEGQLGMESSYDMASVDPLPYTLKKAGVVWVARDELGNFLRDILLAPDWGDRILVRLCEDEEGLAVGVGCIYKTSPEAAPQDCLDMYLNSGGAVVDYSLSSPVYTYVSGGMYEGFATPLFLSARREALNIVADENALTDYALTGYSFADGELPDGVLSSSLADSVMGEGIGFATPTRHALLLGQVPSDDAQIGVTVELAKRLYGEVSTALGRTLNLLMLDSVREVEGGYANGFMEVTLRISGIFEGDDPVLIHDSFFPQALAFEHSEMSPESVVCDAFVLRFASLEAMDEQLIRLRELYPQYTFSAPVRDMLTSLDAMVTTVGRGLGIFGAVSIVLAVLLLCLNLLLVVRRSQRRLGDLLSVGFSPGRVQLSIVIQALCIGLVAALEAAVGLLIAGRIAAGQLASIFDTAGLFDTGLAVALASIICLAACGLAGLTISFRARKISPSCAFRNR